MMKILLINPPIEDFYQTEIRQEPLGLEYLAAVLQQQSHQVKILDALASGKKRVIPLPPQ
ncbi:radical SAM protein, partial [candidate division KSB1 bacterium]